MAGYELYASMEERVQEDYMFFKSGKLYGHKTVQLTNNRFGLSVQNECDGATHGLRMEVTMNGLNYIRTDILTTMKTGTNIRIANDSLP